MGNLFSIYQILEKSGFTLAVALGIFTIGLILLYNINNFNMADPVDNQQPVQEGQEEEWSS